jgi:hypothetical protein
LAAANLSNLTQCILDSKAAFRNATAPRLPLRHATAVRKLRDARRKLPRLYGLRVVDGLLDVVRDAGTGGFANVRNDWSDHLSAVLQGGSSYRERATNAFQEIVADVYDGFLGELEAVGLLPEHDVVAPLVRWVRLDLHDAEDDGPFTVGPEPDFGVQAGVVGLPTTHAVGALMGWTLLGHETAGHDVVGSNRKLKSELRTKVRRTLNRRVPRWLVDYWAARIEETASDVMGVLNIGPAAAVGMIAYFRGWNEALGFGRSLLLAGTPDDEHPAEILRGFVVAEATRLLDFDAAQAWAGRIFAEVEHDRRGHTIYAAGKPVRKHDAIESANRVARLIATRKLVALGGRALADLQNWSNADETIVADLARTIRGRTPIPRRFPREYFAAHALAAAVAAALSGTRVRHAFNRMKRTLERMHTQSQIWGPNP